MVATAEEIETETYRECALCCDIIDKNDKSFYFWDSERLVNVCRNCAGRFLEKGERIIGITKNLKETRMAKTLISRNHTTHYLKY